MHLLGAVGDNSFVRGRQLVFLFAGVKGRYRPKVLLVREWITPLLRPVGYRRAGGGGGG